MDLALLGKRWVPNKATTKFFMECSPSAGVLRLRSALYQGDLSVDPILAHFISSDNASYIVSTLIWKKK